MRKAMLLGSCGVCVAVFALFGIDPAAAQSQEREALVEEVIVTAQRREQRLVDVPVSISAFSQSEMDDRSITSIDDIARITPSLNLARGSDIDANISIRGVLSDAGAGTTGIYINDTPIQVRQIGFNASDIFPRVFDLERVEVLRGPQGTLFGAGSEGGTVRFITPEPSLSDYSVYGRMSGASTQHGAPSWEFGVAGGGPIIEDELGFRASLWHRRDGGYVDRVSRRTDTDGFTAVDDNANWQDSYVGRAAFKWAPSEDLEILPSVYFQRIERNDTDFFWANFSDTDSGEFRNLEPTSQPIEDRFILPSLQIRYAMDFATAVFNASYYDRRQTIEDDFTTFDQVLFTGVPFPILPGQRATSFDTNEQENYTYEARLESSEDRFGRLSWVAGVFYSENSQIAVQRVEDLFLGEVLTRTYGLGIVEFFGIPLVEDRFIFDNFEDVTDKQLAGFVQADYEVIDGLTLTAGVRVSDTEFNIFNVVGGPVLGPFVTDEVGQKETPVTPKFAISYKPADDQLFYASASEGFRIGGANAAVGLPCGLTDGDPVAGTALGRLGLTDRPLTFDSDSLWSYEIGAKNSLWGGRVQTDVSAYHIDWSNIQQNVPLAACGFRFFDNLGSADINGVELSASMEPIEGLRLSLAIGYTDAQFNETVFATPLATAPLVSKGDKLAIPPFTLNFVAQYTFMGPGEREYFVRLDWDYTDEVEGPTQFTNVNNGGVDPRERLDPSTDFVVLHAGTQLGDFAVSLFVENLLNSDPVLSFNLDPNNSPLIRHQTFRPRTFGWQAIYRY